MLRICHQRTPFFPSSPFDEESKGLLLKQKGEDKEALLQFYIAIGKKFDAPALYITTANLLNKYGLYKEELDVIKKGLRNISKNSSSKHKEKLLRRKESIEKMIGKNYRK